MKKLLLLVLGFVSVSAHAVAWDRNTDFLWSASTGKIDTFAGQGSGNVWSTAAQVKPSALGPQLNRPKSLPFNPSPNATFKSTFTPTNIAKGLMNPSSAIITLAGAAILNRILDEACVQVFGGGMQISPGGQWEECRYSPQTNTVYTAGAISFPVNQRGTGSSASAACSNNASNAAQTIRNDSIKYTDTITYEVVSSSETACNLKKTTVKVYDSGGGNTVVGNPFNSGMTKQSVTTQVRDGWQPITNVNLEPKFAGILDQWSQADFLYGKDGLNGDAAQVLDKIITSGNAVDIESFDIDFPATLPGTTSSTTSGDVTTNSTTTNNYNQSRTGPVNVTVTHNVSTSVSTVNNSTGAVTNVSNSTETGKEIEVCGLPGKPACKLDETGTPDPKENEKLTEITEAFDSLDASLNDATKVDGKETGWGLSPFWLTSGSCQPTLLYTLPPSLGSMPIGFNICPSLPVIYTLMNLLWLVSTFLAVSGMVARVTMGSSG